MDQSHRFDGLFEELTGNAPFPWQRRLFGEWFSVGRLPPAVDIPTGLGKTSVMAVWLLARAGGAALPRRLVYVVDRRTVVDQATDCAKTLRDNLGRPDIAHVRQGLGLDDRKLPISTLRGRYADNREWLEDPAAPAIVVGTVDMIGSRLLFSGYGVSRKMRPYQAGFMGADTLVVVDEAHLVPPFERLLRTIAESREFTGPAATPAWPPPFRILPLSATLCGGSESEPFRLGRDDRGDEAVRKRLCAVKILTIEDMDADARLEEVLAERAWRVGQEETGKRGAPGILIYCNSRETARKVEEDLRRRAEGAADTILFVGGRRMRDREEDVKALNDHGFLADSGVTPDKPVFLVATSAGEVGVDLDADHMVCDLVSWERMVQRLGRVNRRGAGTARVLVIAQGAPDGKKSDEDEIACRRAVRKLLEALPRTEAGGHDASPAALDRLQKETGAEGVAEASTRPPLYPALSRPLVDAWAMTSLVEHTGRPEVAPWLRGWVDDEQQTTVVWRRCLPLRFVAAEMQEPNPGEIEAFFDAAPPQTVELLETETRSVVDWLKKRAQRLLKSLDKQAAGRRDRDGEASDGEAPVEDGGYGLIEPLKPATPVVFMLGKGSDSEYSHLSLKEIDGRSPKDLFPLLVGQRLVVDARIGGIKDGLLDPSHCEFVSTIENGWGDSEIPEDRPEDGGPEIRVRVLGDDARKKEQRISPEASGDSSHRWQESFAAPYRLSEDGEETEVWLVVDERPGAAGDEEARAMTAKPLGLADHQERVGREAERIAEAIGLPPPDRAMLVAAARHHDDGKRVELWQRAFNAKREGRPWAKTSGPLNRHVLGGYRHEFQSVLDAEKNGLDGLDRSDPRFDLALHLMAAHHGYARPVIAVEGCDGLPPSAAAGRAREAARRFARLQRRWGPWGLAWWEALLRAADQRASREPEADAGQGAG